MGGKVMCSNFQYTEKFFSLVFHPEPIPRCKFLLLFLFKPGFYDIAKAGLKLTMQFRLASNSQSFCLKTPTVLGLQASYHIR